jgi:hypothetical protein
LLAGDEGSRDRVVAHLGGGFLERLVHEEELRGERGVPGAIEPAVEQRVEVGHPLCGGVVGAGDRTHPRREPHVRTLRRLELR